MPPRQWKHRLHDMREAVDKILDYCRGIDTEAVFRADLKTIDACIRNFQILGEASGKVPKAVQEDIAGIAWSEIKGMRNILVHEYFGVSTPILWNTIKKNIPELKVAIDGALEKLTLPAHPWRICPPGETFVNSASVKSHLREGHPVDKHLRREHCREIKGSGKDTLNPSEVKLMAEVFFPGLSVRPSSDALGVPKFGTAFDSYIAGWTRYWNDVLQPPEPLDPNIVKALIFSESSFRPNLGKGKREGAKGLMQLMPLTLKALRGYRNELKDHLFEFEDGDVYDPNFHIALGIRWLHQKRITASRRLGRVATWDEAVEEYKDYLRRRPAGSTKPHPKMDQYLRALSKLRSGSPS